MLLSHVIRAKTCVTMRAMNQMTPAPRIGAAHWLIGLNVLAFVLQWSDQRSAMQWFALWPLNLGSLAESPDLFELWQIVTSAFLHGSIMHLAFNMLGLWMFGREVEAAFGTRRFLVLYFVSVLTASFCQLLTMALVEEFVPTIGASGGVMGILLAFAMLYPKRIIVLLIPPIPLPAWLFVPLFALVELFLGLSGKQSGVAHFAHLGGMLGSLVLTRYWLRKRRRVT